MGWLSHLGLTAIMHAVLHRKLGLDPSEMNAAFLKKLEEAFERAQSLDSSEDVQSFLRELGLQDANLAQELSRLLNIGEQADEMLSLKASKRLDLLLTTFGTGEKRDTQRELFEFLRSLSDSDHADGFAHLRGFTLMETVSLGSNRFVFRGRDENLQRDVAVKVLSPSVAKNLSDHRAFVREAQLSSSVRHPNVVMIHQVVSEPAEGLAFYVTDWIVGESLQTWLTNHPRPSRKTALQILRQIALGLDAIHGNGIIHRDLKPGNIVLNQEDRHVTILDFGLAIENTRTEDPRVLPAGTPLFMSPEQLACENLTFQTDLFSLGEIGCLLLTGEHPYPVGSVEELSAELLHGEPKLSKSTEQCGPQLHLVLKRALAKIPGERFPSGSEFVDAVTKALELDFGERLTPELTRVETRVNAQRRSQISVAISIATLALVLVGSFALSGDLRTRIFGTRPTPDDSIEANLIGDTGESGSKSERSGAWVSEDKFSNWMGMDLIKIPLHQYETWPPDPSRPELFENLGWRNIGRPVLVGERLVTRRQFDLLMNQDSETELSEDDARLDQPVTGITRLEAEEFCRRLSNQDPDGMTYTVISHNFWTLGVFGNAVNGGLSDLEGYSSTFKLLSQGVSRDEVKPSTLPGLRDVFGPYWEWTMKPVLKPPKPDGIVPYHEIPETPAYALCEVLGGGTTDLFVHQHDFYFGMNDYYAGSSNLRHRIEEDGETAYLAPMRKGEPGWVRYRYMFDRPLIEASVNLPFFLAHDTSRAGIDIRTNRSDLEKPLTEQEWEPVCELEGKIYTERIGERVDLTRLVEGATQVELSYWVEDSEEPVWYSQIGRVHLAGPRFNKLLFQAMTGGRGESMRQSVVLPVTFKHPWVGFRVVATWPAADATHAPQE